MKMLQRNDYRKENTMIRRTFWTEVRFTGSVLILGCILFMVAASLTPTDEKGTFMYSLPLQGQLLAIFHRWSSWHWGLILFCIAVVLTLLGFARLTMVLRDAGDRAFSQPGLIAFVLAVGFFLINMAFRLSMEYWAAQETVRTNAIPALYLPSRLWADALFGIYTALAFFAALAYGAALVSTRILPRWLGWIIMAYSLVGLVLFASAGDMPPFVHYLLPLVMGILLLLPRSQLPARKHREEARTSASPTAVAEGKQ
jgi:MFS family permease